MALYKRGMAKAKDHDHEGAIDDYTVTLEMPRTSAELTAMVLYNRALAYVAAGNEASGIQDLNAISKMNTAPANVKRMAKQKLVRMSLRSRKCRA